MTDDFFSPTHNPGIYEHCWVTRYLKFEGLDKGRIEVLVENAERVKLMMPLLVTTAASDPADAGVADIADDCWTRFKPRCHRPKC